MNSSHVVQIALLEKICYLGRNFFGTFHDQFVVYLQKQLSFRELDNKLAFWLVAIEGDTVAGYIGSQTVMDETDMMNVAVHPDFRRQGIAEALITGLVEHLKTIGSRCLTLEVRASNAPAIALYEKLGFSEIGRRKNYYRNPREDALILRKEWEL